MTSLATGGRLSQAEQNSSRVFLVLDPDLELQVIHYSPYLYSDSN